MAEKPNYITKNGNDVLENSSSRESALKITYSQLNDLIQRNVSTSINKTYTQYAKNTIMGYLQSPAANIDNIRSVSQFLARSSTLYDKILRYYSTSPYFYYNLIQTNTMWKDVEERKSIKNFDKVAKRIHGFDLKKYFQNAIYQTVRDGMYVGYVYGDGDHTFLMPLDIKYCRIWGKNSAGQWIVYFDATYFSGNNRIYVEGVNGDGAGLWDDVFVEGYNAYLEDRRNSRWFMLPPEKCFCMIAGSDDQFDVPLPLFVGLFISLLDLSDLERIIASKDELENYKLLITKIPFIKNSEEVDDFSVSLNLIKSMQQALDESVPSLVGTGLLPITDDLQVVDFDHSDVANSTDRLARSVSNLFNNAGISQLVVAGGSSTNSVGLKFAIRNDMSNVWVYVNRIESWLNYFIEKNISTNYILSIHHIDWYNVEDYIAQKKDELSFGGSLLSYLTALGKTPYEAVNELMFDNALGIKDMMKPLVTSYTTTDKAGDKNTGRDEEDDSDLSDEGIDTRDGEKNNV